MNRIKRWTTSIVSSFENVINQVENHESVVASSIRELQEAAARAKVKLARLQREVASMRSRETELLRSSAAWAERALQFRDSDKPKAIECLRRRKRAEADLALLRLDIPQHADLAERIEADVSKIQARIDELRRKKVAFSSRASRAKAAELASISQIENGAELEDIFERWEIKLAESEIVAHVANDPLEDSFLRAEDAAALELELEQLSSESKPNR